MRLAVLLVLLVGCEGVTSVAVPPAPSVSEDCHSAKNTCTDYKPYWKNACPSGKRCIQFKNSCEHQVALAYNIGCNGDGTTGAPQCNCTPGNLLPRGHSIYWEIADGDYKSCLPSWKPSCLTAGLAVVANVHDATCTKGTRVEFTAGNSADPYNKFDSYNLDIEKHWYSVPVKVSPAESCAIDHELHDCRPVWCDSRSCPDAYSTPVNGGCSDGRSPQVGCQDTFIGGLGMTVEYCPADCHEGCPSCQNAKACP